MVQSGTKPSTNFPGHHIGPRRGRRHRDACGVAHGLDGFRAVVSAFVKAVPDMKLTTIRTC
jgi:hypothetical protein